MSLSGEQCGECGSLSHYNAPSQRRLLVEDADLGATDYLLSSLITTVDTGDPAVGKHIPKPVLND